MFRVARCPVTALAFAAAQAPEGSPVALVLAAGCADGSVQLHGVGAPQLGSALSSRLSSASGGAGVGPKAEVAAGSCAGTGGSGSGSLLRPPPLLQPLGQAVAPDMRAVVSLAAMCDPAADGEENVQFSFCICRVYLATTCHHSALRLQLCCARIAPLCVRLDVRACSLQEKLVRKLVHRNIIF